MSQVAAAVVKREVNSLALLGLKCAANVFDLSSSLTHVSIRDQIIRGQLLVRDLREVDPSCRSLLIVGAGVAGLAAAAEAAWTPAGEKPIEVTVIDLASKPLSLLRKVTSRYVGPFMYEWPGPTYGNQDFPPAAGLLWPSHRPSTPNWSSSPPMTAQDFARQFEAWVITYGSTHPNLRIWMDVLRSEVQPFVRSFVANARSKCAPYIMKLRPPASGVLELKTARSWLGNSSTWSPIRPDYIILAAGMGAEDTKLCDRSSVQGLAFWADDRLKDSSVPCQKLGVFGGGDGALQDVLRILTDAKHPIELLENICQDFHVRQLINGHEQELRAAEDQSRLYGTWTQGGEAYIQADSACSDICKTLSNDATVRSVVLSQLRTCDHGSPGELHHFVRGSNFSKAYMLNRFLVHLLRHCYVKETNSRLWSNVMKYHVHWQAHAMAGHSLPSGETQVDITQAGGGTAQPRYVFDEVVVRYGIEENSMPTRQMVRLSQNESGQRTTLAQVHLPHLLYG